MEPESGTEGDSDFGSDDSDDVGLGSKKRKRPKAKAKSRAKAKAKSKSKAFTEKIGSCPTPVGTMAITHQSTVDFSV